MQFVMRTVIPSCLRYTLNMFRILRSIWYLERNNMLTDIQCGFRKRKSIVTFYFVGPPRKKRVLFQGQSFVYHLNINQMKQIIPSYIIDIAKYGIIGGGGAKSLMIVMWLVDELMLISQMMYT